MGDCDERCEKIKDEIHLLINELSNDEEYLQRLKKFIKFKTVCNQSKSNTSS